MGQPGVYYAHVNHNPRNIFSYFAPLYNPFGGVYPQPYALLGLGLAMIFTAHGLIGLANTRDLNYGVSPCLSVGTFGRLETVSYLTTTLYVGRA